MTAFVGLQLLAVIGFAALWRIPSRSHTLVFTLLSWPIFFSLVTGQDTVFLLLWIALAVSLAGKEKPFWSGVVFSLCA